MLYFFSGSDREKARTALNVAIEKVSNRVARVVRITDVNTRADLEATLRGRGMFGEVHATVFDGTMVSEEMRDLVLGSLPMLKESADVFFILEEKPDVNTRKHIEKYAEKSERYDVPPKKRDDDIFAIGSALRKRDKRALWISYQRELAKDVAPEAIHGVLFWGAKQFLLSARSAEDRRRGQRLIATLAELPHESRRRSEDFEYALERFVLSGL